MLVVLYHLEEAVSRTADGWLWAPLAQIARHGHLGVDIFFVISGFVIALSVSRGDPTVSYFGRFILRRSIRLDPPYWTAILLELLLLWATTRLLPEHRVDFPTVPQLLAHLVYLQELLGYGSVVVIFWTLCYEVQFYVFYVALQVARAKLPSGLQGAWLTTAVAVLLFVGSLAVRYWRPAWFPPGVALDRWFQFFVGVLTWRAATDAKHLPALALGWCAIGLSIVAAGARVEQSATIVVSAVILASLRWDALGRWLRHRTLLWLGTISYSLYLYHSMIGWRFVSLVQRSIPGPWSPPLAFGVFVVAIAVAVVGAAILCRLVEQPVLEFAKRVRLPLKSAAASSAPASAAAAVGS